MTSNWSEIELARSRMDNLVWKEIYGALLACRRNMVEDSPPELLSLPMNGEPYITRNNVAVQQVWCENLTINDILDQSGEFKTPDDYPPRRRPVFYEHTAIVSALKDYITSHQYTCGRSHEGCLRVIGT